MCLICVIRGEEIVQRRIEHMLPDDVSNADTINGITRDQQPVYYFAIGSMTNPVALALRNLVPISSQPVRVVK